MTSFLGIDPGKNGGMALWEPEEGYVTLVPISGPKKRGGHFHIGPLLNTFLDFNPTAIVIEEVSPRTGEGIVSAATFARCHGLLIGMVEAFRALRWTGSTLLRPTPQVWKAKVLAGKMRGDKFERERFDEITSGHNVIGDLTPHTQDALLLAAYGAISYGFPVPTCA